MSSKAFQAAKIKMVMSRPFFASILLGLDVIEDPAEKNLRIDGKTLAYGPEFFESKTLHEAEFALCQNVMHVALGHHLRMSGRIPKLWNDACDYAVNHDLAAAGVVLPKGVLLDPRFAGKTAESIYAVLQAEEEQKKRQEQQQQQRLFRAGRSMFLVLLIKQEQQPV